MRSSLFNNFSSLSELLDYLDNTRSTWRHTDAEVNTYSRNHFCGCSYPEAIHMARYGWPDGREQMTRNIELAGLLQQTSRAPLRALDVGGAYPLIPAAVAGDPMCMFSISEDETRTRQIIRFLVSISYSSKIKPHQIMNRGAAILSWVDRLEDAGARVEIIAVDSLNCTRPSKGYTKAADHSNKTLAITVKRAEDALDVDRLAFALIHPAMLRRIGFAHQERFPDQERVNARGVPDDWIHPDLITQHAVYFPKLLAWSNGTNDGWDYDTPEKALAKVRAIIEAGTQAPTEND